MITAATTEDGHSVSTDVAVPVIIGNKVNVTQTCGMTDRIISAVVKNIELW